MAEGCTAKEVVASTLSSEIDLEARSGGSVRNRLGDEVASTLYRPKGTDLEKTLFTLISGPGEIVDRIKRKQSKDFDEGAKLARIRNALERLDVDPDTLSIVHVTGTKGKGSTCAFCESILRHKGYRTAMFTSPHLLRVEERFRVCGVPVGEFRCAALRTF